MRNRIAPVLVATLIFACSSNSTNQDGSGGNASMTFALSGGDFTNNSVRICGSRTAPDPKYRCNWSLTPDIEAGTDAGDACPCFNFNADGSLVDNDAGAPAVITGLCPSADFPPANWDFSYALFASPNCQGTQLNDGDHNFTCYDSKDIATQQYANQSIDEVLVSGPNTNHILCNTVNASKQWNFGSCATTGTPAEIGAGNVYFDCGCTPVDGGGGTCDCGEGGVTAGDLEEGCSFDPDTCNIVCIPPIGDLRSCTPAVSQSILVSGTDVVTYLPGSGWADTTHLGVSVIHVEDTSITPTTIPTPVPVVSCSSNDVTGQTVCVGSDTSVYLIEGTGVVDQLFSEAGGLFQFPDGHCENCYVMMDSLNNRAVIGMGVDARGTGGFQILDLNTVPPSWVGPPFASHTRTQPHQIGVGPFLDPTRDLLLSSALNDDSVHTPNMDIFEVINVSDPSIPAFFERSLGLAPLPANPSWISSVGEDCSTGIAVAALSPAYPTPNSFYVTDLEQATFTSPSWTSPGQVQTLSESNVATDQLSVVMAQGTHQGVVGGSMAMGITAIQLPATSGSGTPAITDWISCGIFPGSWSGYTPYVFNAYKSPNTGHAMATARSMSYGNYLYVVDLTKMLDPTITPRTPDGHACAGLLASDVVRSIPIP